MEKPTPEKRPVGRPRKKPLAEIDHSADNASSFSTPEEPIPRVKQKPRCAAHPQISIFNYNKDEKSAEMPQRKDQKLAAHSTPTASKQINPDFDLGQKQRRSQEAQQKPVSKKYILSNETQSCGFPPTKKQRQATRNVPFQEEELELLGEDHSDAQLTIKKHRNQPQKAGYSSAQPPQRPAHKGGNGATRLTLVAPFPPLPPVWVLSPPSPPSPPVCLTSWLVVWVSRKAFACSANTAKTRA